MSNVIHSEEVTVNETQQAIIDYLRKHPLSTAREIAAATSENLF